MGINSCVGLIYFEQCVKTTDLSLMSKIHTIRTNTNGANTVIVIDSVCPHVDNTFVHLRQPVEFWKIRSFGEMHTNWIRDSD